MSDRIEFMLKYGTADHVRSVVRNCRQGHYNHTWALHTALKNPVCPSDLVDLAYSTKGGGSGFQTLAIKHPNLSPELHKKALSHSSSDVREAAIFNPQTTDDQLAHARENDSDFGVRSTAANILNKKNNRLT